MDFERSFYKFFGKNCLFCAANSPRGLVVRVGSRATNDKFTDRAPDLFGLLDSLSLRALAVLIISCFILLNSSLNYEGCWIDWRP